MVNKFLEKNYDEIMLMAKKIVKTREYKEVAHEAIADFIVNKKCEQLVKSGEALKYLSGVIHLSYYSTTSPYYKKFKLFKTVEYNDITSSENDTYDLEKDKMLDKIEQIIKDKTIDIDIWFNLTILKIYSENRNYSLLSRQTKIPRAAITNAVKEAIQYIKTKL